MENKDLKKLPDDEIYNLYAKDNLSLRKLAERYEVDKDTIKSRLRREGITDFKRVFNKNCKDCGEVIITKSYNKIYCCSCGKKRNNECNIRYVKNNPEKAKESRKKYKNNNQDKISKLDKEYSKNNRDKINTNARNVYSPSKRKAKYIKFKDKYRERVIETKRNYYRKRRKEDSAFRIMERASGLVRNAFKLYTKTGKIMSSSEYGIDYKAIIEHLKPFPENISLYHIDHIIPLCSFNFINPDGSTNLEEIKKAFKPENHQWLLAKDNLSKGAKIEKQISLI